MSWADHLRVHMTGGARVSHENGKAILMGHYPNPEAGERILTVFYWLSIAVLIIIPAIYYSPLGEPDGSLGTALNAIWHGLPHAIGQLGYLVPAWRGDAPASELYGWGYALGFAAVTFGGGFLISRLWAAFTARPYLRIIADADTLSIQRGALGEPVELPRNEISGVHVGRRGGGTYDVLIQHKYTLLPVAIIGGRESRALALKAKIDAMFHES